MLEKAEHAAGEDGPCAVVAGGAEQPETHEDLEVGEPFAVDLRLEQHGDQVVLGVAAALGDHLHRLLPGLPHHVRHRLLGGPQVLVAEAERDVGLLDVVLVVLLGRADERADHPGHDRAGHIVDQIALAALRHAVEHPVDDRTDAVRVLGDALRGEATLEQRLEAVVARRIHGDHLLLLRLERDPEVVEHQDPAHLGGEGRSSPCRCRARRRHG